MKNKFHDLGTYCMFEVLQRCSSAKLIHTGNQWVASLIKKKLNLRRSLLQWLWNEMKVFNFSPAFQCQRNWESGHTMLGIGVGDQYLAGHIFDHQMYLWGTWEPTVKTGIAQGLLQGPKGFGQLQQLLCSFLESWAAAGLGSQNSTMTSLFYSLVSL